MSASSSTGKKAISGFLIAFILALMILINLPKKSPHPIPSTKPSSSQNSQDLLRNGLEDWVTHLVDPVPSPRLEDANLSPTDQNSNSTETFQIIQLEGVQTLHINGKLRGGISTRKAHENYHLSLRYKWGSQKAAPADKSKRDSGILIHSYGHSVSRLSGLMKGLEYQLHPWAAGDFRCHSTRAKVRSIMGPNKKGKTIATFSPQAHPSQTSQRVFYERKKRPSKSWNTVDIYTVGTTTIFTLNDELTMLIEDTEKYFQREYYPLAKGKIQLQSGGSEIFFQDITLKKLKTFPHRFQNLLEGPEKNQPYLAHSIKD